MYSRVTQLNNMCMQEYNLLAAKHAQRDMRDVENFLRREKYCILDANFVPTCPSYRAPTKMLQTVK